MFEVQRSLEAIYTILVVSCSMWSGAIDSSSVLLSYPVISLAQHITIVLISTLKHLYLYIYICIYLYIYTSTVTCNLNPLKYCLESIRGEFLRLAQHSDLFDRACWDLLPAAVEYEGVGAGARERESREGNKRGGAGDGESKDSTDRAKTKTGLMSMMNMNMDQGGQGHKTYAQAAGSAGSAGASGAQAQSKGLGLVNPNSAVGMAAGITSVTRAAARVPQKVR